MPFRNRQLSQMELVAFCEQIAMIINAGLPTYYGVSILRDEAADEPTKSLLSQIYTPMENGAPLYEALQATGRFPSYMLHMIKLGETTGRLEEVLRSLSTYYQRESQIRDGIKKAVSYPLIMTTMMIAIILVLIAKVLPVFSNIYKELGSELTGFARLLLRISNLLNRYMAVFVVLFFFILLFGFILYHTDLGRVFFLNHQLAITVAASRFANCMYLALASGLDTDRGLALAKELVNNPHMQQRIEKCENEIHLGASFDRALISSHIFSPLYASFITIGYKTGEMDKVMQQISEAYEKHTDEQLSHLISILEPTLVIILCIFIGLILVSLLLPLLGLMSSIG